jgi:hypothetical protein
VCAVLPVYFVAAAGQTHIGFVHQSRCLERLARLLTTNVAMGKRLELVVYQRQKPVEGLAVAFSPRGEQLRHFVRSSRHQRLAFERRAIILIRNGFKQGRSGIYSPQITQKRQLKPLPRADSLPGLAGDIRNLNAILRSDLDTDPPSIPLYVMT